MNPEMPRPPREEIEVRLSALLLGELSAEEAAALRELIAKDPQLAELHERLKRAIDLVREAAATGAEPTTAHAQATPLKLSDERRQKLLAHFKTVAPKEFITRPRRRQWSWMVPLAAAALFVAMLGAFALLPGFSRREMIIDQLGAEGPQDSTAEIAEAIASRSLPASVQKTEARKGSAPRIPSEDGSQRREIVLPTGGNAAGTIVTSSSEPAGTIATPSAPVTLYDLAPAREEKRLAAKSPAPSANRPSVDQVFQKGGATRSMPSADEKQREIESVEVRFTGITPTPRQEIVLPPSIAPNDAAKAQFETPTVQQDQGGREFPLGSLLATTSTSGPGGVFGGGGAGGAGGGGGGGYGPVAEAQADPNARNARGSSDFFANPEWAGAMESPVPSSGGSTNQVVSRFAFALQPPGVNGDVTALELQPGKHSLPNEPSANIEARFAESNHSDNKALGFLWYDRELERGSQIGLQGGAAPSIPNQPSKAKPGVRDADAEVSARGDNQSLASVATTSPGQALQEKRVEARVTDAPRTVTAVTSPDGTAVLNRFNGSDQLARKRDGSVDLYAGQVPILGEEPGVGRLFRSNTSAADAEGKARSEVEPSAAPQTAGKDLAKLSAGKSGGIVAKDPEPNGRLDQRAERLGESVIPLGVDAARATDAAGKPILRDAAASEDAVRGRLPAIALPSATTDTTAGLPFVITGSEVRGYSPDPTLESKLLKRTEAAAESAKKQEADLTGKKRPYLEARQEVESLQRETNSDPADATPPKTAAPASTPQPEIQTRDNAFSTFALNVSDVSFKLAGASLEKGVMPEPATVRSEEFINAFDYRDPEPPPGVPIAFAWERTRYPFAHNRDLLRFSVKTAAAGRQSGRSLNLVLLLDNSGSMERADRVQIIHEALRVLAAQLQPQDKLSVVTFARTARLWVDGLPGNQAGAVAEQISSLTPQGGTNLGDAMDLAYQTALRHYLANGVNRIVLLTDGAANLGNVDPDALKQKVEAHRKQGVALDCFGIGWEGYNDDLLENLSRNGDGRYGFINTPEEAASDFAGQLAGALRVAASDVKVQVEFNPGRVTAYRQIGYAKHQLTKEQFRDNTVDAAEIGAAESGNALYVAEVNARGEGPLAIVRVRYKVPGTADYREHEWAVPYSGNAVALEQASPGMRLAATASALPEWLVSSPYAAEITPDRLLGYLGGVPETYGADVRPKKLEWMIRQAKSISGK